LPEPISRLPLDVAVLIGSVEVAFRGLWATVNLVRWRGHDTGGSTVGGRLVGPLVGCDVDVDLHDRTAAAAAAQLAYWSTLRRVGGPRRGLAPRPPPGP
jgi:hypothetical protein